MFVFRCPSLQESAGFAIMGVDSKNLPVLPLRFSIPAKSMQNSRPPQQNLRLDRRNCAGTIDNDERVVASLLPPKHVGKSGKNIAIVRCVLKDKSIFGFGCRPLALPRQQAASPEAGLQIGTVLLQALINQDQRNIQMMGCDLVAHLLLPPGRLILALRQSESRKNARKNPGQLDRPVAR